MLRKLILSAALTAALAMPASVDAAQKHANGGSRGVAAHAPSVKAPAVRSFSAKPSGKFVAKGGPRVHHSHGRHFWRGRWWAYGVGPCWVWSSYYDEYIWQCD